MVILLTSVLHRQSQTFRNDSGDTMMVIITNNGIRNAHATLHAESKALYMIQYVKDKKVTFAFYYTFRRTKDFIDEYLKSLFVLNLKV